jgi:hypothetical protein
MPRSGDSSPEEARPDVKRPSLFARAFSFSAQQPFRLGRLILFLPCGVA